ncbi:MAG: TonB-dependent receptor [Candidatus Neomarinimicrobiota bacterium]
MGRIINKIILIGMVMLLMFAICSAGITGKIRGIITDKTTGSPLIGANVILEGTVFGSATDQNGEYFILSVPPGTYSLNISIIGYKKTTITDIKVIIDHTTTVNAAMVTQAIDLGEEVVVVAKRPVIQKDITNSTQFVELEELIQLPFRDAKEALMVQTGVFLDPLPVVSGPNATGRGEQRYSIRGGDQGEVKWFVDGVRVASLIEGRADRGGSFSNININSVQEVQIITSGFNAEYGEAQSGIVNVATKEGKDKINFSFDYEYGLAGQHHFGNYIYSHPNSAKYQNYINNMYGEYNSWSASFGSSVPTAADSAAFGERMSAADEKWWSKYQKEYRDHTNAPDDIWWLDYDYKYHNDSLALGALDPDWMTAYRKKNIYNYRKIPDYNFYFTVGGPLFKIGDIASTFFLASQLKSEAYTLPHPRNSHDVTNLTYNFAFQIKSNMKLRLSGLYNLDEASTMQEYGQYMNQAKYYRGWGSLLDTKNVLVSALWDHIISDKMNYDLKLSYYLTDIKEYPSEYTELGSSLNPDIWGWQRYNKLSYETSVEPFDAWSFIYDQHWQTSDLSMIGSWNWQWNSFNYFKSGFEFRYNKYAELKSYRFASSTEWQEHPELYMNRGLNKTYYPVQFATYIQNKMEFESMILNLGLRYDYFNANREWFATNNIYQFSANPDYQESLDPDGDQVDSNGNIKYCWENVLNQPQEKVDPYHMISPRLGVSFPITDKTLMHFSYGHFYQMPPLDRMFELSYLRSLYLVNAIAAENAAAAAEGREPSHIPSNSGDPERVVFLTLEPLKPELTKSFEVGVKQNFGDLASLEVTAFYKDMFDKTDARAQLFDRRIYGYNPYIKETSQTIFYVSSFPGDYGDARGVEVTFRTLMSSNYTLDISYSFSKSTVGRASPACIKIDSSGNYTYTWDSDVNKRIPVQNTYSRPHTLRANLYLKYPDDLRIPVITPLFKGTSASILYQFVSGQTFTYAEVDDPPDTYDNYRYPPYQTVNLRLEKTFKIGKDNQFIAFARVTNLFNWKCLISLGSDYWGSSSKVILADYIDNGNVTTVDTYGYDISWLTYAPPRRIYFGLKYCFR